MGLEAGPKSWRRCLAVLASLSALALPSLAWEPTAAVELVVPAGSGGGADQMARFIQGLVSTHKLMQQPMTVVNKAGNSGLDGLLDIKASRGNPHKLVITLSNLFTAPLASGADFNWRDITPVQLMALDQFVLWVPAGAPFKTAKEWLATLRSKPAGSFSLGGTGSKQEDQIVSVLLETAVGTRINYQALKGGGDVAKALANREVDMSVNNPIEAEALWRAGQLLPLCVLDGKALEYSAKVSGSLGWSDIPTCMSAGIPVQYLMMRAIFTTPGATAEQVAFYKQLLDKVRALPEWKAFMAQGAFNQTSMSGPAFVNWLDTADRFHHVLMRESKLRATPGGAIIPVAPKK